MTKQDMTAAILAAKKAGKKTWASIAKAAGLSETFTCSACLGENAVSPAVAKRIGRHLKLPAKVVAELSELADKGTRAPTLPKEPLQYRFQEVIYVYGTTLKAIIEEKFGAGIMSAIDFSLDVERVPDPNGDRVKVTMNGKFLPYKTW